MVLLMTVAATRATTPGKRVWSFPTQGDIYSSPTVADSVRATALLPVCGSLARVVGAS